MKRIVTIVFSIFLTFYSYSQNQPWQGKFEPIDNMINQPNSFRAASGAPGKDYWQQRANYIIDVVLDEKNNTINIGDPS